MLAQSIAEPGQPENTELILAKGGSRWFEC
jgi:hypothetical protein